MKEKLKEGEWNNKITFSGLEEMMLNMKQALVLVKEQMVQNQKELLRQSISRKQSK